MASIVFSVDAAEQRSKVLPMDLYPYILRILHVGGAAFWAGASWLLAGFLTPAVKEIDQGGPAVMRYMVQRKNLTEVFGAAALITVLSGLLLYWRSSSGLNPGWLTSGPGLSLTLGAVAGLAAFLIGFSVNRPVSKKMGELGDEIAASQGPPSPELLADLGQMQSRLEAAGVWTSVLLAVAVLAMAGAESLYF